MCPGQAHGPASALLSWAIDGVQPWLLQAMVAVRCTLFCFMALTCSATMVHIMSRAGEGSDVQQAPGEVQVAPGQLGTRHGVLCWADGSASRASLSAASTTATSHRQGGLTICGLAQSPPAKALRLWSSFERPVPCVTHFQCILLCSRLACGELEPICGCSWHAF